jgi:hypothetical protein
VTGVLVSLKVEITAIYGTHTVQKSVKVKHQQRRKRKKGGNLYALELLPPKGNAAFYYTSLVS